MSKRKKNNQINLKDFILEILKNNKSTMNSRQLAWALNMKGGKHLKKITSSLKKLEHEKLIIQSEKYKFQYNNNKFTTGVIDINKAGNGYVSSKFYKDDIFIEKKKPT
ncbi:MAG: hypothetical protein CMP49_00460 [Flavobacteriales bacterium]|nr:hypothetical protein [Flavobacteriales bacterium]